MKKLKFSKEIIPKILSGEVASTWRLFDDKNLEIGDTFEVVNSENSQIIGYAKITQITNKYLKDINNEDQQGHQKYADLNEIVEDFKKYYGDGVGEHTPMKIIKFDFLGDKLAEKDVIKSTAIDELKIYTDGGSRGNPGPSACGYVITDIEGNLLKSDGAYLGVTTNNQAEYQAVRRALQCAENYQAKSIHIYMDSLLVVNQMKGIFKIRNRDLWPINEEIKKQIEKFDSVSFTHIPREMNKQADQQVNDILDNQQKTGLNSELV